MEVKKSNAIKIIYFPRKAHLTCLVFSIVKIVLDQPPTCGLKLIKVIQTPSLNNYYNY